MHRFVTTPLVLILAALACRPAPKGNVAPENVGSREARILANLELAFPQFAKLDVTMGEIRPSDYAGLDVGSYTIVGPQGRTRTQKFFVSVDDKRLYLLAREPIDVSRSAGEIEAVLEERAAEAARVAAARQPRLEDAVAGLPTRGNPSAPVLIVEFSDFQCPFCARSAETVEEILGRYGDDVRFVFKHFPLEIHPWARPAAIAAHCAARQSHDAFWALHDAYFENQGQITTANVLDKSAEYLAGSGIDLEALKVCAGDEDSSEYRAAAARVEADMELGRELGVSGTPAFFVDGEFLSGAQPLTAFEPLIAKAKGAS